MDHAEVRELLEIAAAEPAGLDAFLGGRSSDSERMREHLAACHACASELSALRDSAATIREVIRGTPPPDLRARTLDLVAATGRARTAPAPAPPRRRGFLRSLVPTAALGAVAAAVVVGAVTWRAVDARLAAADAQIAEQRHAITGLTVVTDWTLRLAAAPDAQLIQLAGVTASGASGTVLLSPEHGELVMVATGLPAAPAGYEYRCWVDQGSGPVAIGEMYQFGRVAYWGGAVPRLQGIEAPFTMGVTLASVASEGLNGEALLQGSR